jgi:arylsulfatase A-like enzyme
VGTILDALEETRLTGNTIVVLRGDHAFDLSEHGMWCKNNNFEITLHEPLMIRAPGYPAGQRTRALVEFVDIYPSLCELAKLPLPDHLQGTSFVPVMERPDGPWKRAVFSRCDDGDSVRTNRFRYTFYRDKAGNTAEMLYDHDNDPGENVNIAGRPENAEIVNQMRRLLDTGWEACKAPADR